MFGITDQEQRELRTIISTDMAADRRRERDRERDTARRRAAGAVDRETYLEAAQSKQAQAQELRAQGLSVRAIAEQMGISKTAVGRYVAASQVAPLLQQSEAKNKGVPSPSPITIDSAIKY